MNKASQKIAVGIVDDQENVRTIVTATLSSMEDMECNDVFETCEDALSGLKQRHLPLDVILLDIGLPGINGLDGIKRLKALSPTTKIVMMSVDETDKSVFRALTEGANGYIVKGSSFTGEYLAGAIREVEKEGIFLDPAVARKLVEMLKSVSRPARDYGLTEREKETLCLSVEGLSLEKIGKKLNITYNTAASHYKSILAKLAVHDKGQLVKKAILDHLV